MSYQFTTYAEAYKRVDELGESICYGKDGFDAFERKYLSAYEIIFDTLAEVTTVAENLTPPEKEATLSMSRWMEPARIIGIVVRKKAAFKPSLLTAAHKALAQIGDKFALVFDDYPTTVYVFPDNMVLVSPESREDDLRSLGLTTPSP